MDLCKHCGNSCDPNIQPLFYFGYGPLCIDCCDEFALEDKILADAEKQNAEPVELPWE